MSADGSGWEPEYCFHYACGHPAPRRLLGPVASFPLQIAAYTRKLAELVCTDCYRQSKAEQHAVAAQANASAGFAKIGGTLSERLWAEQIRFDFAAAWRARQIDEVQIRERASVFGDAATWIDLRHHRPEALGFALDAWVSNAQARLPEFTEAVRELLMAELSRSVMPKFWHQAWRRWSSLQCAAASNEDGESGCASARASTLDPSRPSSDPCSRSPGARAVPSS